MPFERLTLIQLSIYNKSVGEKGFKKTVTNEHQLII